MSEIVENIEVTEETEETVDSLIEKFVDLTKKSSE